MFAFINWIFLCICFFSVTQKIKRKSFKKQKHQAMTLYKHAIIVSLSTNDQKECGYSVDGKPDIGSGIVGVHSHLLNHQSMQALSIGSTSNMNCFTPCCYKQKAVAKTPCSNCQECSHLFLVILLTANFYTFIPLPTLFSN